MMVSATWNDSTIFLYYVGSASSKPLERISAIISSQGNEGQKSASVWVEELMRRSYAGSSIVSQSNAFLFSLHRSQDADRKENIMPCESPEWNAQRARYMDEISQTHPGCIWLQQHDDRCITLSADAQTLAENLMSVTQSIGHAKTIARELDLRIYDTIGILSGDGGIYEVINGLASRPTDGWKALRETSIGIIPVGEEYIALLS
jgi:hypothetical protein